LVSILFETPPFFIHFISFIMKPKKIFLVAAVVGCGAVVAVSSCKKKSSDPTYTCKCLNANPTVADKLNVSESEANTLETQQCGTKPTGSKLAKTTGINWSCD
jgi:hypothetical protein